ncbi:MAG: ribose-phosphate pyrophosphokinase [Myxococcales bacterium]|nr:ribose-phosphate pyrophosphokinase [Myxococcales bacterium]MCB9755588.1 ribose-phosphate pyrophosphokinase [Myxococcales bacterium]
MTTAKDRSPLLFSIPAYDYLREELLALGGFERGELSTKLFPDGERYMRLQSDVEGREVVLVGGTIDDAATLMVYDLACAIVKLGARKITLVVPYFAYSTMERAVQPGEVVTAKTRARLLSSIPPASYGNRIVLLDLHSEGIPHYFEGELTAIHVYGKPLVRAAARRLGGDAGEFVLACTDAGRAKWVESLAQDLHVTPAFVFKRRLSGSETEVAAVSAQVEGRRVIIYDDMIRTGGSLLGAARAYKDAGATSLAVITTHALLPGDALGRLRRSGLFTDIVATDSHPRARELASEGLAVESCAALLHEHL